MAELVDALDLKSNWYLNASAGSSPARGTLNPCSSNNYELQGFFVYKDKFLFDLSGDKVGTRIEIIPTVFSALKNAQFESKQPESVIPFRYSFNLLCDNYSILNY